MQGGIPPCIPDSHPYRIINTKCCIDTVISPDDGHIVVQNMHKKEINILRKIVHQVGFIYKTVICVKKKKTLVWENIKFLPPGTHTRTTIRDVKECIEQRYNNACNTKLVKSHSYGGSSNSRLVSDSMVCSQPLHKKC
jgi:hypothetical protein